MERTARSAVSASLGSTVEDHNLPAQGVQDANNIQSMLTTQLQQGKLSARLADPRIPYSIRRKLLEIAVEKQVGKMEDYGLPTPDHVEVRLT